VRKRARTQKPLKKADTGNVSADATNRIWGNDGFRLFLSHRGGVKKKTADLKDRLRLFGITGFVAHEDIRPTKAWQDEIENALLSMDGFVALMTKNFHESDWTDQEVGFALARRVPIVAVRLGRDPYGFIGRFQGLSSTWSMAAEDIAKILMKNDSMVTAYIKALQRCPNFDTGNMLGNALDGIEVISPEQIDAFVTVYNQTYELRWSWAFNGSRPNSSGPGLVWYLNRLGDRKFILSSENVIELAK
jgi:hypothetical protein